MKKILPLLGLCILFFSIYSSFDVVEEVQPVFAVEPGEAYYEIDVNDLGITTKNLNERLGKFQVVRIYPKLSSVYSDRIEQKYYSINPEKTLIDNCSLMQERYLFLLNHYGYVHDRQQYQIYGVPISKIIVLMREEEIEENLKQYSLTKTVLG